MVFRLSVVYMKLMKQAAVGHEPQYFHATTANISDRPVQYHFLKQTPLAPGMSHTFRKETQE